MKANPYLPSLVKIEGIKEEVEGHRAIKTFRLVFQDDKIKKDFSFIPGQCVMISLFGSGECMFAISSSPTQKDYIEVSVMKHGKVTSALHKLDKGDTIGIRGIGQAPLRSVINYTLDNREDYGNIDIIYGARTSADLCYKDEFVELEKRNDVKVHLSIDVEEEEWDKFVGFVPDNLLEVNPTPENAIAITCGPPIMIHYVIQNLLKLGFKEKQIYTTLEMRMKCGIGICGRCNIGNLYVCKDGPVFSYDQLKELQGDM